eukprot:TRINITY_DN18520_c0_g1_i1.p1 TRINITY_DN18520_c0_g1~~TRINITY_DN18520_c0_g1_i1.p1  ORF type:complete len:1189 (+),score=360.80 TRINITY_DN18520_c0_g1_i1:88-3654(+)
MAAGRSRPRCCGQLAAAAALLSCAAAQEQAFSCEGFIKASAELGAALQAVGGALPTKDISVQLVTQGGAVRESAQVSPDGYYALPLSDAAGPLSLALQLPAGWRADRLSVPLTPSPGVACLKDADFSVESVDVSGVVPDAPGVRVELQSASGALKHYGLTQADGSFSVERVLPGEYTFTLSRTDPARLVEGSDKEYALRTDFAGSGQTVRVAAPGPLALRTPPSVAGACIWGTATLRGRPLQGAEVALPAAGGKAREVATTDENGVYLFCGVPGGTEVALSCSHKVFSMRPTVLKMKAGAGAARAPAAFTAFGFTASGSVVSGADQKGVVAAAVELRPTGGEGSVMKGSTDAAGRFSIPDVPVADYTVHVQKKGYAFAEGRISPAAPEASPVRALTVSVCGRLTVTDSRFDVGRIGVNFARGKEKLSRKAEASGDWCFQVAPLAEPFAVTLSVPAEDAQRGLTLSPAAARGAAAEPVADLHFTQAVIKVTGSVHCVAGCPPSGVSVVVRAEGRPGLEYRSPVAASGAWSVDGVPPGKYVAKAEHPGWCWGADAEFEAQEQKKQATGVTLQQTGFELSIDMPGLSGVRLDITHEGGSTESRELQEGANLICVSRPGKYTLKPHSCHRFAPDSYSVSTQGGEASAVELTAAALVVRGTVQAQLPQGRKDVEVNIMVARGPDLSKVSEVLKTTKGAVAGGAATFEYELGGRGGEQLVLTPKAPGLLFYPESRRVTLPRGECPPPVEAFTANDGAYITGRVMPPTKGIKIGVTEVGGSAPSSATDVVTGDDGKYRVGPVYSDRTYTVHAAKRGYVFTEERVSALQVNFAARRLSAIVVRAVDGSNGEPLSAVFVSLSGGGSGKDRYRNNTHTGDDGEQEFVSLPPGKYYLRLAQKEYVFEDTGAREVTVTEGEHKEVEMRGRRVAYSCYGTLRSLAGTPEQGVVVEALGDNNEVEEARSGKDGEFRIRGLKPGARYVVSVRPGSAEAAGAAERQLPPVERSAPPSFEVSEAESKDVRGLNFFVFRQPPTFDIRGTVSVDGDATDKLELQLVNHNGAVIRNQPLTLARYFEFAAVRRPAAAAAAFTVRAVPQTAHGGVEYAATRVAAYDPKGAPLPYVDVALSVDAGPTDEGAHQQDARSATSGMGIIAAGACIAILCIMRDQLSEGLHACQQVDFRLKPKQVRQVKMVTRAR